MSTDVCMFSFSRMVFFVLCESSYVWESWYFLRVTTLSDAAAQTYNMDFWCKYNFDDTRAYNDEQIVASVQ